jgi:hypothetical protein
VFARFLAAGALVPLCIVTASQATVIDNFEAVNFSIVTPGPSVHHLGDPASIIGGDRDVFTPIYAGAGSSAILTTTAGDDSVVITSNGNIFNVDFQYEGVGINARALNYDLTLDGDNAILVDISSVSPSPATPVEIFLNISTRYGTPDFGSAILSRIVSEPGVLTFPFSAFEPIAGELDLSEVDFISLNVTVDRSASVSIRDIRTGFVIPEPSIIAQFGVMLFLVNTYRRGRHE